MGLRCFTKSNYLGIWDVPISKPPTKEGACKKHWMALKCIGHISSNKKHNCKKYRGNLFSQASVVDNGDGTTSRLCCSCEYEGDTPLQMSSSLPQEDISPP